ncbi:TonB-dependent receptor domain-containing protein [Rubellicoccus peritrichatus]|uniref:TonB-dependent receptor n=1 Tax=Rubellicoccus peritrichatus TaxID=3080537 RepID=A0AAQ3LBL0_9BACT|nr:TonB-dependent receptor [Puniceicoccus sp. CR14]WOO42741.1 TonB-dependent receptor [Puniceicoccus sp. CR14]
MSKVTRSGSVRAFSLLGAALLLGASAKAEVAGVIYDGETALEIPEASVFIKDTELSTQSTEEGRFIIEDVPPGTYAISFSKPGFQRVTVTDIVVPSDAASNIQVILNPDYGAATELDEVTMTLSQLESATAMLLADRQTASSLMDSIGSDDFSRLGIGDAADALSKVTGATIVGGSYVYIRGLGDRYGNTTLNDIIIPSPDPDVNSVPLDLFPSGSIESIETFKTFTPDKPADFTGGLVNIATKGIPEETILDVGISMNYNTQATGNSNFLTFPGGGDFVWAGYTDSSFDQPDLSGTTTGQERASEFSGAIFPTTKSPLPDMGIKATYGDSWEIGNTPLGLITSIDFDHEYDFFANGTQQRINPTPGRINPVTTNLSDSVGTETSTLGGLIGTAIQPTPDDAFGITFLYNHSGEKEAELLEGFQEDASTEFGTNDPFRSSALRWIERQLWVAQVDGDHTFTRFLDTEFHWYAQYGEADQDEPDNRFYQDIFDVDSGRFRTSNAIDPPERRWRQVNENRRDLGSDFTIPFDVGVPDDTAEFKSGFLVNSTRRETTQEVYSYTFIQASEDPNNTIRNPLTSISLPSDSSFQGKRSIWAGYAMFDIPINDKIRFIFGGRVEDTNINVDAVLGTGPVNSNLQETDFLPAVNAIWSVTDTMNVRAAATKTIARPTFRELSPIQTLDFLGGDVIEGNPNLQITSAENYDLRWEWFPGETEVFAASIFYKRLKNPIEATVSNAGGARFVNTWLNFPKGELYGFEIEADQNLAIIDPALDSLTVGFNYAYVQSSVDAIPGVTSSGTRPLEGQSENVVNLDVTFAPADIGLSMTLAYNYFSRRLTQVGQGSIPDIYEEPVSTLDFFITQRFGDDDEWAVTLSFKNILNPVIERTYDGTDFTYSSYKKGRDIGISASYSFY